ncbi:MAG: hypothetical protein K2J32_11325 [Ruminococcus sp.]|nr:hypothetical protein [Ruminococcus sp.]MDE5772260.1 hypothetical protein [Ruminococcus sp.]MDE6426897.1 hypothetical protein [Ruminococcus sp.]MDE6500815.1 hypothetical protein [Ruminococcus sp.]
MWVSANDANRNMPLMTQIDEEYSEELHTLSSNMEIEVQLAVETSDLQ